MELPTTSSYAFYIFWSRSVLRTIVSLQINEGPPWLCKSGLIAMKKSFLFDLILC
jgi:hypothetical protein